MILYDDRMTTPTLITSPDNPRVKALAKLRKHRDRDATGLFVAEGEREITRALQAKLPCAELFWCSDMKGPWPQRSTAIRDVGQARVFEVNQRVLDKLSYLENPDGVVAVFEQPHWQLETFPPANAASSGELWLVAVGTSKPGNLGAMVRSANAAGATGVLVADGGVDPFNPNAIRASTGAVFFTPVLAAAAPQIVQFLRNRNLRIITTTPRATRLYTDVDLRGSVALVIGPEDTGLDAFWLDQDRADESVRVPLQGGIVDSLNASVTAAVLLFEAIRQRGKR